jgi:hypothetical protein
MGSLLETSVCILIVRRTEEIICKEDKRFEITVRPAIGVKKDPNAIALKHTVG